MGRPARPVKEWSGVKIAEKLGARNSDARANRPVVIACLGDSVTHGCFEVFINRFGGIDTVYKPEQGYTARLQRRLRALAPTCAANVIDCGISGDNARGGLERLERDALSLKPDLVIVNFGLNDSMFENVDSGVVMYERSMRGIFEAVLKSGAEAMLLTPNRMCDYVSHKVMEPQWRDIAQQAADVQNRGVLDRYVDAARSVAGDLFVPVADAYARWNRLHAAGVDTTALLANAINHPAEDMHDIFVEKILEAMFEK